MKTAREPSFFIPGIKRHQYEAAYESMKAMVKYQMGWTVKERRIESLTYTSGKKTITAKVGEFGAIEHRHKVAAIMEASLYLIMTKTSTGEPGPTILVDPKEVLEAHDFKPKAEKPKAVLQPVI